MGVNTPEEQPSSAVAEAAREVIGLLEVLWDHGRDAVPTTPVSSSQLRVLHVLHEEDGINLRRLGTVLGATASSVSRLCDRLEAMGLVERSPSPVSRRELELHLTRRAETYLEELRARRESALREVLDRMPATERRSLVKGLAGFRTAAHAVRAEQEAEAGRGVRPAAGSTRSA
jgi:DNA-binding MarR family transcriptional regulator